MAALEDNPAYFAGDDGEEDKGLPMASTLQDATSSVREPVLNALSQVLYGNDTHLTIAQLKGVLLTFKVSPCLPATRENLLAMMKHVRGVLRQEAKESGSWGKAAAAFASGDKDMRAALKMGSPIKTLVFSWNVGNAKPAEEELALWCPENGGEFDLVVVGTQENKYKNKKASQAAAAAAAVDGDDRDGDDKDDDEEEEVVLTEAEAEEAEKKATAGGREDGNHWDSIVAARLGDDWGVVRAGVLWQMRLSVFARNRHLTGDLRQIWGANLAKSRTGIGGVVANKGGLVCSFNFGSTALCFLSSHLAAHTHKLKQRNSNCQEILRETGRLAENHLDAASHFDHIFWLGDLNYRVDMSKKCAEDGMDEHPHVLKCVDSGDFETLVTYDQLKLAQASGEAFVNFVEGPLDFKPTFKVLRHPGSEYKKNRIPSYCDRVLWKSMPQRREAVRQTLFTGLEDVSTSDHKPVVAHFEIEASMAVNQLPPKQLSRAPILRFKSLKATGVASADLNGLSDPFVVFYSNPPKLFGPVAPRSRVIKGTLNPEWSIEQIPVLRPLVADPAELRECAIIIVLYDHDLVSFNDQLGRVILKLAPPDGAIDPANPTYSVKFEEPLINGNVSAGMGTVEGEFTVSFGADLDRAVLETKEAKVGSKAGSKQRKSKGLCAIV